MKVKNLKLIAKTQEDLKVLSAHLQDSIANVSDIANLKKNKIYEEIIYVSDLTSNTKIMLFNSVRGCKSAVLI